MANGNGDIPLRLRQALPNKIRELSRRTRKESEIYSDSAEYDFTYSDQDTLDNELAELYSYSEEQDIQDCVDSYEHFHANYVKQNWYELSEDDKRKHINQLMELVLNDVVHQSTSTQCLLYLVQGKYNECSSLDECISLARDNVFLIYDCGFLPVLLELIHTQAKEWKSENRQADHVEDSLALRILLNILYTMMLLIHSSTEEKYKDKKNSFIQAIKRPFNDYPNLGIFMLKFVFWYEKGLSVLPIKKVVLIFWKYLVLTLGTLEELDELKKRLREEHNLRSWIEPRDLPSNIWHVLQPQFPDKVLAAEDAEDDLEERSSYHEDEESEACRRLPWKPKARQRDLELYLSTCRQKFLGYQLDGDTTTMVGLPDSIQEGVDILQQHLYISMGDLAVKHQEKMCKTAKRKRRIIFYHPPAEELYTTMLPQMEDYIIALLKVLLASASTPVSKAKANGTINVLIDVIPEDISQIEPLRVQKDINRHKEIITKAVSTSLLLLLKHFRLNHVYQFEFLTQCMFYANCIPLVLKFLNQDMNIFVTAQNSIPSLDFPKCLFEPELRPDESRPIIDPDDPVEAPVPQLCWRNLFSTINMLRLIQKLTKWRPPRTMMLHVFKSAPILKKTLKITHWMVHLYVLKLFKLQAKYLGKNWRKTNMKILSSIYQHVRHRLLDDWAYGNDLDSRQWEFPNEEQLLKSNLDRYHAMWYRDILPNLPLPDLPAQIDDEETCKDIEKLLNEEIELPKGFETNYRAWVKKEVYDTEYDWDVLLEQWG